MMTTIEVGEVFSRLTVLTLLPPKLQYGRGTWARVRCECGSELDVRQDSLKRRKVRSCGCLTRERTVAVHTKHGRRSGRHQDRTYLSWANAKARTTNPKAPNWHRYGGRGIRMATVWADDFGVFLRDMGERPLGKTLDRIDNDGDYEPGNCRWATPKEQQANRGHAPDRTLPEVLAALRAIR